MTSAGVALGAFTGAGSAAASKTMAASPIVDRSDRHLDDAGIQDDNVAGSMDRRPRKSEIMEFATKVLPSAADDIVPDGSEVRLLTGVTRGGMAHFALGARQVSKAVAHKTIEEIWYFIGGRGRRIVAAAREEFGSGRRVPGRLDHDPDRHPLPVQKRHR